MASNGSFTTTSCEGRSLTFSWSIKSQSIENNTTTISWSLTGSGSYTYGWVTCGGFNVVINGATVYNKSTDYRINVYNGTTVASGEYTIAHNSDGTKTFSASAQAGIYTYAVNCSGSGSWALTTIPRTSSFTLSSTSINVGSSITANITPASSSFSHKVRFYINDTYTSDSFSLSAGTNSKSFTIPANWLPNSSSTTVHCNVATYSDSTYIGHTTKSFTVAVPTTATYQPTVGTISIDPANITTSDGTSRNILVQGKNKVTISVSGCSAGSGSSIKSYKFSGPGINSTTTQTSVTSSGPISNTGTLTYTVVVTDSRGRTASKTATISCYAYATPSFKTFSAVRTNADGVADENGAYVKCSYSLGYSSVNSTNNVTVKIYYKKNTAASYASVEVLSKSTNTSGSKILSSIATSSTYTIYAIVTDNYGGTSSSSSVSIFSVERVINVRPNGSGIALGKMAESNNVLDVKWPIKSDDPAKTMQNLSYRGTNLISSTLNDTIDNWSTQGNLITTYYNQTGQLNGQPTQYGFLLNLTTGSSGKQVHQMWLAQSNGNIYHRGGNSNGIAATWKTLIDSSNYTTYVSQKPVTLYNNGNGTNGTITLNQSINDFSYIEIFYCDNWSRQRNCVKFAVGDSNYITLSCIEPSTNNTDPRLYIRTSGWTIVEKSMTPGRSDLDGQNRGVYTQIYKDVGGTNVDVSVTVNNYIKIYRILGYK